MLYFRHVVHEEAPAMLEMDAGPTVFRTDVTSVPFFGGHGRIDMADVYLPPSADQPPDLSEVRRMILRAPRINCGSDSLTAATANGGIGLVGAGAGALLLGASVLNPVGLGLAALYGLTTGLAQYRHLTAAQAQDRLLIDIARLSQVYADHPGLDSEEWLDAVLEVGAAAYRAGGVACSRYIDLADALVARGLLRRS